LAFYRWYASDPVGLFAAVQSRSRCWMCWRRCGWCVIYPRKLAAALPSPGSAGALATSSAWWWPGSCSG